MGVLNPKRSWKILVVDDHPIMRQALRDLLSQESDLRVVAEASNPTDALVAIREHSPDLVFVDLTLGPDNGLTLVATVRQIFPETKILVLSMRDETIWAQHAIQAGANGFVGKHEEQGEIIRALRRVLGGKPFVSEAVADILLGSLGHHGEPQTKGRDSLSKREIEVLRMVGEGKKTSEIAKTLAVSPKTVETHRARIKEKLGIESGGSLTVLAVNWMRDGYL